MPPWLQITAVAFVLASAAWVYAAAALWLVGGAGRWYWRVAPLALLMTALLPIGAYELVVLFGGQVAVIMAAGFASWLLHRRKNVAAESSARWRPQFGLRDLIAAVALLATVLAIGRNASFNPIWSGADYGWLWILVTAGLGAGLGAIALATGPHERGRGLPWRRAAILTAALAATLYGFSHYQPAAMFLPGDGRYGRELFDVAVVLGYAVLTGLWSFAARRARETSVPDETIAASSITRTVSPAWTAALVVVTVLPLVPLVDAYRALLPPTVPPPAELPKPNGYDLVTQLEATLNWTAIPTMEVAEASAAACQQFARDNAALFARLSEALKMPSRVPLDYYDPMSWSILASEDARRKLGRALYCRARAEASLDRTGQAVATYLELVQLGNAGARGGGVSPYLIAQNAAGVARGGIYGLVDRLSSEQLATLVNELPRIEGGREDLDEVTSRELLSSRIGFGWMMRLMEWISDRITHAPGVEIAMRGAVRREDAEHRLLLTHIALKRFQLARGELPESLAQLMPEYLPDVPQDPFSEGPLVYRREPMGYLLYSVGHNGRDDGGVPSEQNNLIERDHGDLVLERVE
jgi:hypothetical protein